MAIKYFLSKAIQNLPKLGFLFFKKPSGNPGLVSLRIVKNDIPQNYNMKKSTSQTG
jgi:hypothetical protein